MCNNTDLRCEIPPYDICLFIYDDAGDAFIHIGISSWEIESVCTFSATCVKEPKCPNLL